MKKLLDLFITFAKMGAVTFGGGYAMLPILQREIVENKKWGTEEELADYYAIGQCTPGVIAVNVATFIGRKVAGNLGGVVATIGVVFPSLVIITLLAGVIEYYSSLEWVSHAFAGIRVCVCVLIFNAVLKLIKKAVIDFKTLAIYLLVLVCYFVSDFNISPVIFVIAAGLAGILLKTSRNEEVGSRNNSLFLISNFSLSFSNFSFLISNFSLLLKLFWEFFNTGLFAVGGGMATLPFLYDIADRTMWFSRQDLANMIAVSESTPGPIGINMATYAGYLTAGIPGAVIATLGLITPSIIVILLIAAFLNAFHDNKFVNGAFYGLRPASCAMITAAGFVVAHVTFINNNIKALSYLDRIEWPALILAAILIIFTNFIKPTKKFHPVFWIFVAAVVGIVFKF